MPKLPFSFETPENSPGFLLWQTTMMWQRRIKKSLEEYDISHAQFVIMATLMWFNAQDRNITQILIINQTKLDKMTVSKSLKKLADLGLVTRIEHAIDSRAKNVYLTEKGKKMVRRLVPIAEEIDNTFFNKASPQEQEALIHILTKLTMDIKDE